MHAFCYASGLIGFADRVPDGAIEIARGPEQRLRSLIECTARHGYSTRLVEGRPTRMEGSDTLLVPGVPEAPDQRRAADALERWLDWIKGHAARGVTVCR